MSNEDGLSEDEEREADEFLLDTALALAWSYIKADEGYKVAYALGEVLTSLVDGEEVDQVMNALNALVYVHVHEIPSEADIDTQTENFRKLLDRVSDSPLKPKEEKEGD